MKGAGDLRHPLAAALLGVLLLDACAKVQYPTSYILNFPRPAPPTTAPRKAFGAVVVREFGCPDYLCQGRIVYRPSPVEVGFYEYHRWAMNPRQSITRFMADTLRAQSLFQYVATQEPGIGAAYVLTGRIERLEEVDRGSDVHVECAISAQLLDARTGSVVWSDTASEMAPVENRNIPGVVSSLTAAAQITVDRLVKSMANQLASTR
ncbi:MAG: ABC-type transport auxiliary lipoprotein family protein [Bryobacteraceae bacterium]